MLGGEARSEVVQRAGEQPHQLVVRVLAERAGDLRGRERAQLARAPGAVPREAVAQAERDGPVARAALALAQRREPAGAEVDRVERERERGPQLGRAGDERLVAGRRLRGGQRRRVRRDHLLVERDVGRARRDPRAALADLVDERHAADRTRGAPSQARRAAPCSWSSSQRLTSVPQRKPPSAAAGAHDAVAGDEERGRVAGAGGAGGAHGARAAAAARRARRTSRASPGGICAQLVPRALEERRRRPARPGSRRSREVAVVVGADGAA